MTRCVSWGVCAAFALTMGCGMSGAGVLKSPVQDQCESVGLSGCPQIAEGVVLYADGKQADGQNKLKAGAAANNPEDVREFAKALTTVTSLPIPGVSQYVGPLHQIAELLATEAESSAPPVPKAAPPVPEQSSQELAKEGESPREQASAIIASAGPTLAQTVSASTQAWSGRRQCHLFGRNVSCAPVQQGPFIVTDIVALPGCKDAMYIGSNARDNPYREDVTYVFKWAVEAQQPGVHGAHLAVQPGESLLVAVEPKDGAAVEDPGCVVSWSGYHPRRSGL